MPTWFWKKPPQSATVPPEASPLVPAPGAKPVTSTELATHKLSRTQQFRVCELLGQHYDTVEVAEAVQEEFGIRISKTAVGLYGLTPKWQTIIQAYRTAFLADAMTTIPIAKKPVRLRRYENLYQRAMRNQELNQARLALLAAQGEMEGLGETNIYVHQQILHMDTAALEARRKELTERLQALEVTHAVSEA